MLEGSSLRVSDREAVCSSDSVSEVLADRDMDHESVSEGVEELLRDSDCEKEDDSDSDDDSVSDIERTSDMEVVELSSFVAEPERLQDPDFELDISSVIDEESEGVEELVMVGESEVLLDMERVYEAVISSDID